MSSAKYCYGADEDRPTREDRSRVVGRERIELDHDNIEDDGWTYPHQTNCPKGQEKVPPSFRPCNMLDQFVDASQQNWWDQAKRWTEQYEETFADCPQRPTNWSEKKRSNGNGQQNRQRNSDVEL
ncbi:MAG: hypothetical protein ACXW5U_18930 [Thermoanaerobaculia bacterium]